MKNLIILAIISCASFAQADILTSWTVNDPQAQMTAQSVFYREDPGPTGDQALLDGTGFTEIAMQLADRSLNFATSSSLQEGVSYCFYWQGVTGSTDGDLYFKTNVKCGVNAPPRIVQRIEFYMLIDDTKIIPVR